jgi:hypothetical protein
MPGKHDGLVFGGRARLLESLWRRRSPTRTQDLDGDDCPVPVLGHIENLTFDVEADRVGKLRGGVVVEVPCPDVVGMERDHTPVVVREYDLPVRPVDAAGKAIG